jgi:hypothetical protein
MSFGKSVLTKYAEPEAFMLSLPSNISVILIIFYKYVANIHNLILLLMKKPTYLQVGLIFSVEMLVLR